MQEVYLANGFFSSIWINSINYLDVISRWIIPAFVPLIFRMICLSICAAILGYFVYLKKIPKMAMPYFIQFAVYVMIMSVFLKVYMDDLERYLAMVYPGLIIGLLLILDGHWVKIKPKLKKLIVISVICWMSYVGVRTFHHVNRWHGSWCAQQTFCFGNNVYFKSWNNSGYLPKIHLTAVECCIQHIHMKTKTIFLKREVSRVQQCIFRETADFNLLGFKSVYF